MNIPSLTDLEDILREKPDIRAQVSRKGVINSALPDALRIKREAIELRERLRQSKASLDHYAATKAAQQTLDALKNRPKETTPIITMKNTPKPSPAPTATAANFATPPLSMTRGEFQKLSDTDKTRFVKAKGKLI